ncbi:unnamed protein product [Closterium sp. NIES-53]
MALRPSTAPLRVPLPSPPASSLPAFPYTESDSLRAASPTVARFLATVVTDPSLVSTAASALVAELVDFASSCRLDYAASLVAESASVCPPSVGGECALSTDVLEDRQEEFHGPRSRNHFYSRHNRSLRCIRSASTGATTSSARSFIASRYTKQDTRSDTRAVFRSLRLAYVASEANTADIFTKALAPGDHQRFCTLLVCFALLDWSCDPLFSPTLPMGVC